MNKLCCSIHHLAFGSSLLPDMDYSTILKVSAPCPRHCCKVEVFSSPVSTAYHNPETRKGSPFPSASR